MPTDVREARLRSTDPVATITDASLAAMKFSVERTLTHLQNLYSVVVGLALAAALMQVLGDQASPINVQLLPAAIAFVATLIPLYHGALRHLDVKYLESGAQPRALTLMSDWLFLFVEGCFLLALGLSVGATSFFALVLLVFLLLDAAWAIVFAPARTWATPQVRWASINFATSVLLAAIVTIATPSLSQAKPDFALGIFVMAVAIVRTFCDYAATRDFYFPFTRS